MSRNIAPKPSVSFTEEDLEIRNTDKNRLLFTTYQGRNCALLIQDGRLIEASFFSKEPGKVGAVYLGRVKNLAKNIDACFIDIGKGETCFLSLKNAASPWLLNRAYDGRLLEGDEILVQVIRDAQKGKRASVTANVSLANEYFVLTIGDNKVGYSSRLSKEKKSAIRKLFGEKALFAPDTGRDCLLYDCNTLLPGAVRQSWKAEGFLLETLKLPPTGLIVRTKAEEAESAEELLGHFYALSTQYISLLYTALHRSCFCCLREADTGFGAFHRFCPGALQNLEIITDQQDIYDRLILEQKLSIGRGAPMEDKWAIRLYQDNMVSLSSLYSVDKKLEDALGSRVWLKSGAYLVIEPTEALTVIDVNSGKYESEKDAQETYLKINLEAAEEIACQLRLRNLSGIILVDFINMQLPAYKKELLQYLKELVSRDRVPTNVIDMTALGLVELTRKKINKPLQEQFMEEWHSRE